MDLDETKLDAMVLALLYINQQTTGSAWKSMPWDSADRLHQAELISNPAKKTKSVWLSEAAEHKAQAFIATFLTTNKNATEKN